MGQSESIPEILARWEWKANSDPFSSEEPIWEPYSPFDNHLLEKAYENKQQEVDIGDYTVSLKNMFQIRKDDNSKQRPVRRNIENINKTNPNQGDRGKRFIEAVPPKTVNNVFGSLADYLAFFQDRSPEAKNFAGLFDQIETSQKLDEMNKTLLPSLIDCLKLEANNLPKITDQQQLQLHEAYEKALLLLFQGIFTDIKQFYGNILKAYTMEGFLYKNLNRYLRNEDWVQLDSLFPYVYCLCKAFFCLELFSNQGNSQQNQPSLQQQGDKMILYRGAQFDKELLNSYNPNTTKHFAWNGITSTSTNRHVAEGFMSWNIPKNKTPVMFIIEVPLTLENVQSATWMDIKPFSAMPREDEVVLAPGSTFELIRVSKQSKKGVEINLRLMTAVDKLVNQGQILHGVMHSTMEKHTEFNPLRTDSYL